MEEEPLSRVLCPTHPSPPTQAPTAYHSISLSMTVTDALIHRHPSNYCLWSAIFSNNALLVNFIFLCFPFVVASTVPMPKPCMTQALSANSGVHTSCRNPLICYCDRRCGCQLDPETMTFCF